MATVVVQRGANALRGVAGALLRGAGVSGPDQPFRDEARPTSTASRLRSINAKENNNAQHYLFVAFPFGWS